VRAVAERGAERDPEDRVRGRVDRRLRGAGGRDDDLSLESVVPDDGRAIAGGERGDDDGEGRQERRAAEHEGE
jgi:hypothetical protein